MKKWFCIALMLLLFMGCQDVQLPEPPAQLIPKEKLIQILADAYISNASRSKGVNNRILRTKGIKLDSILYSKHGIDSLSFAQSNTYYASNINEYTAIIAEVEKVLIRRKAEVDSLANLQKNGNFKKGDSTTITSFKQPDSGTLAEPVQDEEE